MEVEGKRLARGHGSCSGHTHISCFFQHKVWTCTAGIQHKENHIIDACMADLKAYYIAVHFRMLRCG
ncbi:hypothetical protein Mapa_013478 [Marchantia paleacea]|nr:hypothetical protein Mapa_013478 [Marchantia paleacea]